MEKINMFWSYGRIIWKDRDIDLNLPQFMEAYVLKERKLLIFIFIIPRWLCLGVSDHTSPWGRSELLFRNSGWGKIQNLGFWPKAK
jgi:hypothetical protein